eukprot:gb/GEZN01012270.1/.p1 GENE.gb/GEZN01012270.1/~~gb/GEZN01012270.1/.p1  ORF type:complete len:146 (+),score=18.76 gb/GEZN01012270.1/:56-493(+)
MTTVLNFSVEAQKRMQAIGTHSDLAKVNTSAAAVAAWKDLIAKKYDWIIFSIDDKAKEVLLDKTGAAGAGDFDVSVLADAEPRYIGVRKGDHLPILVLYMPQGVKGAARMSYGGAFPEFRKSVGEVLCALSCIDTNSLPALLSHA